MAASSSIYLGLIWAFASLLEDGNAMTTTPVLTTSVNHINSFKPTAVKDNTTFDTLNKKHLQTMLNSLNTGAWSNLANFGGMGSSMSGLRTVMMGGMLYGLSLLPAVALAIGGTSFPMGGLLSTLGLNKRSMMDASPASLPLLSESETRRLMDMLQRAFAQWNIADDKCKQLFVCQMYRQVSTNGVTPDLDLFKEALIQVLEHGGSHRAGRAAETLLLHYEHYFEAARMGMKKEECESFFSKCNLSLYPKNEGVRKSKGVGSSKVVP